MIGLWYTNTCVQRVVVTDNLPLKVDRQRTWELLPSVYWLWWTRLQLPASCLRLQDTGHTYCGCQQVFLSWQSLQGQMQIQMLCNQTARIISTNENKQDPLQGSFKQIGYWKVPLNNANYSSLTHHTNRRLVKLNAVSPYYRLFTSNVLNFYSFLWNKGILSTDMM